MAVPIRPGDKVVIVKQHNLRDDLGVVFNVLLIVFVATGLDFMMSNKGSGVALAADGI